METKKNISHLIDDIRTALDKKLIDSFFLTEYINDDYGLITISLKNSLPSIQKETLRKTLKDDLVKTYSNIEVHLSNDSINLVRIYYHK